MEGQVISGLCGPTSRLKKIFFPYFESLLTLYLRKTRVYLKCGIYLPGCISEDYNTNRELSAPRSDQLCHSFSLVGRSNDSGCVSSPGPTLHHGSQEPACSITAPPIEDINQKGCSW